MAERRRMGWTGLIVGLLVLLAVLWVGYWYAARYAAGAALARLAASGAECAAPTIAGFPLEIEVRCARVTYGDGGDRLNAALGGVAAKAPLYRPGAVDAGIDAPLVVNAPATGVALTATWSLGTAHASAWFGGLTGFGASFVSLDAANADTLPAIPFDKVTAAEASGAIAPAGGGSYAVNAAARQMAITRTDGRTLPKFDGEARITLIGVGDTLGTDPAATLLTWARSGASARIDRLKIAGIGAIVASEGALRVSENGRLTGSILLRWNDIGALADLVEAIFPGTRDRADTPLQGLNAVSIPVTTEDGPMRQTTLTFTEGVIWLGIFPLPIDPIPPIRF